MGNKYLGNPRWPHLRSYGFYWFFTLLRSGLGFLRSFGFLGVSSFVDRSVVRSI